MLAGAVTVALLATAGAALPIATAAQTPNAASPRSHDRVASAPAAVDGSGLTLHLAPVGGVVVDPAGPFTVAVEIGNASAEVLAQGVVRLSGANSSIDSPAELDVWLGDTSTAATAVGEAASPSVASGSTSQVMIGVPAGVLPADAPVVGLRAELVVGDTVVASSDVAFATPAAPAAGAAGVAIAYPLTVPNETGGLIDADDLATYTAPGGLLSNQLDAVADRQVAIAIDPRIIASIRVLGSSAPSTALAWLERLAGVGNVVFPLAYADADVAVQAQLGLPGLLQPTSFTDVLDAADFADGIPGVPTTPPSQPAAEGPVADGTAAEGSATTAGSGHATGAEPLAQTAPASTAAPTPTPDPGDEAAEPVPTVEQLLAWPYTRTDLAWPADDTVASGDLGWLSGVGLTTSILAPGNVEAGAASGARANAASVVDEGTAVVADGRITPALREAAAATSDASWREATGRLGAELALLADPNDAGVSLLGTFGRDGGEGAERVAATLDALATMPWAQPASLSDVIGAPPVARTLASSPESDERRGIVQRMVDSEAQTAGFATAVSDPRLVTGPTRRDLLAVLDSGWLTDPGAWTTTSGEWLVAQDELRRSVSVVPSSPINVISRESGVPTTIENKLAYPVTVFVDVAPSNGRLIVEGREKVTVEPESRASVIVPVAAGVGSGDVTLTVSLYSAEGVEIGTPSYYDVNVQADWEGLGATIIAVLVVAFFAVGIWRNIRRRRKARAAANESDTEAANERDRAADAGDGDASDNGASDADASAHPDAAEDVAPESAEKGSDG